MQREQFEQVVRLVAPQSRLLRTWPLAGGISATMTALELAGPADSRRRLIVRQPSAAVLQHNPWAAQQEYRRLEALHALGLPTPMPYYLDQSGQIVAGPYLVIEYVEGAPEFAPAQMTDCMLQMARQLAMIHAVDAATLDTALFPAPPRSAAERLGARPPRPDESLQERRIRDLLEPAWPPPQHHASTLLHGDFWPGNLLWRAGRLVAVIDWEDARHGDPLADLAVSRLDILWIFGQQAMHTFTAHYCALTSRDMRALAYWDLYAALRLVRLAGPQMAAWAAFFAPFGRPDITEHHIRAQYQFFVSQAFERLGAAPEARG